MFYLAITYDDSWVINGMFPVQSLPSSPHVHGFLILHFFIRSLKQRRLKTRRNCHADPSCRYHYQ